MLNSIQYWLRDESGAVTVDWVVLTAGVVGLGLAAVQSAELGIASLSDDIAVGVASIDVGGSEEE